MKYLVGGAFRCELDVPPGSFLAWNGFGTRALSLAGITEDVSSFLL